MIKIRRQAMAEAKARQVERRQKLLDFISNG